MKIRYQPAPAPPPGVAATAAAEPPVAKAAADEANNVRVAACATDHPASKASPRAAVVGESMAHAVDGFMTSPRRRTIALENTPEQVTAKLAILAAEFHDQDALSGEVTFFGCALLHVAACPSFGSRLGWSVPPAWMRLAIAWSSSSSLTIVCFYVNPTQIDPEVARPR